MGYQEVLYIVWLSQATMFNKRLECIGTVRAVSRTPITHEDPSTAIVTVVLDIEA